MLPEISGLQNFQLESEIFQTQESTEFNLINRREHLAHSVHGLIRWRPRNQEWYAPPPHVHLVLALLRGEHMAVCNSLIIIVYVDEAIDDPPLLLTNPGERAEAQVNQSMVKED